MKINFDEKEITFTFPRFQKRMNPYGSDEENDKGMFGEYPTFTGLIEKHKNGWTEIGFAGTIDMDYADKADQFSGIIVAWLGDEKSFKEKCEELNLDIYEMEV